MNKVSFVSFRRLQSPPPWICPSTHPVFFKISRHQSTRPRTTVFGPHIGHWVPTFKVARSFEIFSRTFCFSKRCGGLLSWASAEVETGIYTPQEIRIENQKFLENLKSASWFRLIDLMLEITLYLPVWHSHCTRASFTGVMSLQFTQVYSFVCKRTLRNLRAHCSTVALCCVTITWQRIFIVSLKATVHAFFRMWLLTSDTFGRWCSETVTADNGKPRCFILCEKKHEWICGNASTSLKNPLQCKMWVWPLYLSEELNQATLMQAAFHTV